MLNFKKEIDVGNMSCKLLRGYPSLTQQIIQQLSCTKTEFHECYSASTDIDSSLNVLSVMKPLQLFPYFQIFIFPGYVLW